MKHTVGQETIGILQIVKVIWWDFILIPQFWKNSLRLDLWDAKNGSLLTDNTYIYIYHVKFVCLKLILFSLLYLDTNSLHVKQIIWFQSNSKGNVFFSFSTIFANSQFHQRNIFNIYYEYSIFKLYNNVPFTVFQLMRIDLNSKKLYRCIFKK